ncbi:hypothetical protein [Anaeromyxobacter diazotrophicus]|uniref:hypothetical protein n=1 Tax=Anaeromyxobacter diazotrophicus TaxID=2590199 RepID=UPI001591D78F|nr:hypothetical protein [Anaeromyxobacter diazotrophicus]
MNKNAAFAAGVALALACTRPATPPPLPDASPPAAEGADGGGAAPPPPGESAEFAADAGSPADSAPAPAPAPAAPAAPAALPVTAALAHVGSQVTPLAREGATLLDPGATFELEVAVHLADGRLSLRDEVDAMVASTGTTELGEGTSRYRLAPDEPLRPGSRYTLHLDGAVTRELHGADGHAFAPLALQLKTSGERPAPPPRKKRGSRR